MDSEDRSFVGLNLQITAIIRNTQVQDLAVPKSVAKQQLVNEPQAFLPCDCPLPRVTCVTCPVQAVSFLQLRRTVSLALLGEIKVPENKI